MKSKATERKEQLISLLHQIGRDYGEKLGRCNLELEWEVDEADAWAEARLFLWRCDDSGNRTSDLIDILEVPWKGDSGDELPLEEIATWLRETLHEILAACGPQEPRPASG